MGKKRAYCPYCDVYLPHNSLNSRRTHNIGWKHIASVQAYYFRYFSQHLQSGYGTGAGTEDNESATNDTRVNQPTKFIYPTAVKPAVPVSNQTPGTQSNIIRPPQFGESSKIIPPPIAKIAPPTISKIAPPPITANTPPKIGPPTINPPKILAAPPKIGPGPLRIGGPPKIGPPRISNQTNT